MTNGLTNCPVCHNEFLIPGLDSSYCPCIGWVFVCELGGGTASEASIYSPRTLLSSQRDLDDDLEASMSEQGLGDRKGLCCRSCARKFIRQSFRTPKDKQNKLARELAASLHGLQVDLARAISPGLFDALPELPDDLVKEQTELYSL